MKAIKVIIILLTSLLFMSFGCSAEEPETNRQSEQECDCKEMRYTLSPGDTSFQYHSFVDRNDLNCEDETDAILYNGFYHIQIVCE